MRDNHTPARGIKDLSQPEGVLVPPEGLTGHPPKVHPQAAQERPQVGSENAEIFTYFIAAKRLHCLLLLWIETWLPLAAVDRNMDGQPSP